MFFPKFLIHQGDIDIVEKYRNMPVASGNKVSSLYSLFKGACMLSTPEKLKGANFHRSIWPSDGSFDMYFGPHAGNPNLLVTLEISASGDVASCSFAS